MQASRVDWSARKHFLATLFKDKLQGTVSLPLRLPRMCPYRSRWNHCGYRYPQHWQFFYWGFLTATSVVPLGWKSGRIQEWLLNAKSNFQNDLQWASEIHQVTHQFLSLRTRLSYRRLHFDIGANKNGNLKLKDWNAGMAKLLPKDKAMANVPTSLFCGIFQKKTPLTNHPWYSFSIHDSLDSVKWTGTSRIHSFAFNISNVFQGGMGLMISLLNITQQWWAPNAVH